MSLTPDAERFKKDMIDKKVLKIERATNQKSYYLKRKGSKLAAFFCG